MKLKTGIRIFFAWLIIGDIYLLKTCQEFGKGGILLLLIALGLLLIARKIFRELELEIESIKQSMEGFGWK